MLDTRGRMESAHNIKTDYIGITGREVLLGIDKKGAEMPKYELKVVVQYNYTVEAEDGDAAEQQGWDYEDYKFTGEVDSITVYELEEDEEEEGEE